MGVVVEVGVAELPEPDDGEGGKAERTGARRKPVEPIGEIDGVGGGRDQEQRPHHPADAPEIPARVVEARERQRRRHVRVLGHEKGEPDTDDQQAEHLRPLVEAQVASGHDLDPVVDQPHRTATDDRKHHEDAGARIDGAHEV